MTEHPSNPEPAAASGIDAEEDTFSSARGKTGSDRFRRRVEGMLKDGVLRNLISDIKLPKELVVHIMSQVDETKQAAVGVISREVRQFLENTDMAEEIEKLLSKFSFEIKTTVRFVPKEEKRPPRAKQKPRAKR